MTKTIGIVGGGQLCLMMGEAVKTKNLPFRIIAIDPTAGCPAAGVIHQQLVGDYKDENMIRKLGELCDVITFEIELANSKVLHELQQKGLPVHPSPKTLAIIQDKLTQAEFLKDHGLPVPRFMEIKNAADVHKAFQDFGLPLMIKARKDSYDGRGNFVLRKHDNIREMMEYFSGKPIMAQQFIPFDMEVSVISVRGINGTIVNFPLGENIHGENYNILETTIVPARVDSAIQQKAAGVAAQTMQAFNGAGVFGIEMFVAGNEILINEIAPRVHNSGHYSIEGCSASQFEQHLLAVSGNELKKANLVSNSVIMHNIFGNPDYSGAYDIVFDGIAITGTQQVLPGVFIHHYNKHIVKPYRKIGHLTVVGTKDENQNDLLKRSELLRQKIKIVIRANGK
jgi:5-(carboxyamino)imidazole ribonucleotide synthase